MWKSIAVSAVWISLGTVVLTLGYFTVGMVLVSHLATYAILADFA